MNRSFSILTVLCLLMMTLAGCVSDGSDGAQGADGAQGMNGQDGLDGSNGLDGVNGTDGTDGANGTNGMNGTDGTDGTDGNSTLIQTFIEYPGMFCEGGGVGLHVGIDDDRDGYLSIDEIDETVYVCNGADGEDGTNGTDGTGGSGSGSGMLNEVHRLSKSDGCPAGGRIMTYGIDNGEGSGTAGNGVLESGEIDDQTTYCSSQRIGMVGDLHPGNNSSNPRSYQGMKLSVGNTLYFSADDGVHGEELWAHDLTTDETWMVADIRSGGLGSFPGWWLGVAHGSIIFFDAWTDDAGRELWAHDQSSGSTYMVANLVADQPQPSGSNPGDDIEIMYGDTLYFSAFTNEYATELWAYDTSNHSTWLVKDIHLGSSANPGWYMNFIHNDVLYFTARDQGNVHDLWAHNQSNQTTWKVVAFGTNPNTHPGSYLQHLVGDVLYFDADTGPIGRELMAYDLVNGTTRVVADLEPGAGSSDPGRHMSMVVGETLVFDTADDSLWAYDLSNDTAWRIEQYADWSPGEDFNEVAIGTTVFFKADDGVSGSELWAYDVVNASTWLVADIVEGSSGSSPGQNFATSINGILYFDASTYGTGRELWAHDSHDGSTWLVIDLSEDDPGFTTPDPDGNPGLAFWAVHRGYLFFDAHESENGRELWKMWFEHSISYN